MHRFFCPAENISADKISITDKEALRHLKDVLRLKVNAAVVIFDNKSNEYDCLIAKISSRIILNIQARRLLPKLQKGPRVTLACAIPKKSKFDDIVDKLTQLGVERIIPLLSERVIVKWDREKKLLQQKRWEKVALCAAEQSQRNTLPIIEPIKELKEVLAQAEDFDLKLIPSLIGKRQSLKEVFAKSKPKNILVFIGPEGDFTTQEIELARKFGCIPVTLGELILRVDTAAIAITSILNYAFSKPALQLNCNAGFE